MISEATNKHFIEELLENLILGSEHTPRILEKLLNQLMLAERETILGASPYERTEDRLDDLRLIFSNVCTNFESQLAEFDGEDDPVHLLINYPSIRKKL